ncbi:MAG: class I tRNA ligase family protein, partial [Oscillospiraceae bacterium]
QKNWQMFWGFIMLTPNKKQHIAENFCRAAMMAFLNDCSSAGKLSKQQYKTLLILLNPFAPHITEELYQIIGFKDMLSQQKWPEFDASKCVEDEIEIVIQINGKVKQKITLPVDCPQETALASAKEKVSQQIEGKQIVKEIFVKNKLINIVVK